MREGEKEGRCYETEEWRSDGGMEELKREGKEKKKNKRKRERGSKLLLLG